MDPLGMSANALTRELGVTPARINEIVRGRRGITADREAAQSLNAIQPRRVE